MLLESSPYSLRTRPSTTSNLRSGDKRTNPYNLRRSSFISHVDWEDDEGEEVEGAEGLENGLEEEIEEEVENNRRVHDNSIVINLSKQPRNIKENKRHDFLDSETTEPFYLARGDCQSKSKLDLPKRTLDLGSEQAQDAKQYQCPSESDRFNHSDFLSSEEKEEEMDPTFLQFSANGAPLHQNLCANQLRNMEFSNPPRNVHSRPSFFGSLSSSTSSFVEPKDTKDSPYVEGGKRVKETTYLSSGHTQSSPMAAAISRRYNLRTRHPTRSANRRLSNPYEYLRINSSRYERSLASKRRGFDQVRTRKAPRLPEGMISWSNVTEELILKSDKPIKNPIQPAEDGSSQPTSNTEQCARKFTVEEQDQLLTFDMIAGMEEYIFRLKEMVVFPLVYPDFFNRLGVTPPRGVLFHGPPGTGKTLLARLLATACSTSSRKVSFFMRNGAECLSKWIGEAEKNMERLFKTAREQQPSIIFFDEIDGLAPERNGKQDQSHVSLVSTLLALMDGLDSRGNVIVIGATNRIDAIDPALRRPGRFDREFLFSLPNEQTRRKIVQIHSRKWTPELSTDLVHRIALETDGYSGADLRALCVEASLNAFRRTFPDLYSADLNLLESTRQSHEHQLQQSEFKVIERDFVKAFKTIVPSSMRNGTVKKEELSKPMEMLAGPLIEELVGEIKQLLIKPEDIQSIKGNEDNVWQDIQSTRPVFLNGLIAIDFEMTECFFTSQILKIVAARVVTAPNVLILDDAEFFKDSHLHMGVEGTLIRLLSTEPNSNPAKNKIVVIPDLAAIVHRLSNGDELGADSTSSLLYRLFSKFSGHYNHYAILTSFQALEQEMPTLCSHPIIKLACRYPSYMALEHYLDYACEYLMGLVEHLITIIDDDTTNTSSCSIIPTANSLTTDLAGICELVSYSAQRIKQLGMERGKYSVQDRLKVKRPTLTQWDQLRIQIIQFVNKLRSKILLGANRVDNLRNEGFSEGKHQKKSLMVHCKDLLKTLPRLIEDILIV